MTRPSDCEDLDHINALVGFGLRTRISIPFDGRINPATVSARSVPPLLDLEQILDLDASSTRSVSRGALAQIADFHRSGGTLVNVPEPIGLWEVPLIERPDALNFIR